MGDCQPEVDSGQKQSQCSVVPTVQQKLQQLRYHKQQKVTGNIPKKNVSHVGQDYYEVDALYGQCLLFTCAKGNT